MGEWEHGRRESTVSDLAASHLPRSTSGSCASNRLHHREVSPAGGSSGSELTNGGGGGGGDRARRRLTLDSRDEEEEEALEQALNPACQRGRSASHLDTVAAADSAAEGDPGIDPGSDSGDDSWRPPFSTPQRGKRTRFSDPPATTASAAASGGVDAGDATPAAAAHARDSPAAGVDAEEAGPSGLQAAEPTPQQTPQQQTPKLIHSALLRPPASPASSARVRFPSWSSETA